MERTGEKLGGEKKKEGRGQIERRRRGRENVPEKGRKAEETRGNMVKEISQYPSLFLFVRGENHTSGSGSSVDAG